MTPNNNAAEDATRPFVIGRESGLFAGTVDVARASADLYSLVETAKAIKIEPYKYLRFLFEKLPFAESNADLRNLLPINLREQDLAIPERVSGI